jgi:hypothetical protein
MVTIVSKLTGVVEKSTGFSTPIASSIIIGGSVIAFFTPVTFLHLVAFIGGAAVSKKLGK